MIPVNGRQIYVNGVNANVPDPQKGGTISNWDNTFALVLGNEVSGDRSWQGLIKFVAIHSRAMSAAQVLQNFNAGVGERYYMLFNVAGVTGVSQAYVMFTVSQYDSYGYLFYQPTFISLDPTVEAEQHSRQGHSHRHQRHDPEGGAGLYPAQHHGHRGELHGAGRRCCRTSARSSAWRTDLWRITFFLQFDQLGSSDQRDRRADAGRTALPLGPVVADVGVRTFAQVNSTLSALTGVPTTNAAVNTTYLAVQQQLPPSPTLESFSSANQVGIAQLAIQYCNVMINTPALQSNMFPGVTFSGSLFSTRRHQLGDRCARDRVLGSGLQEPAGGIDRDHRARQSDQHSCAPTRVRATPPARVAGGDQRRLRRGLRQRRDVDQLSSRRIEEV